MVVLSVGERGKGGGWELVVEVQVNEVVDLARVRSSWGDERRTKIGGVSKELWLEEGGVRLFSLSLPSL